MRKFGNLLLLTWSALVGFAAQADTGGGFVPPECTVESWCVQSATECRFTYFSHPGGLFQGRAQYSVVRRVIALCPEDSYGGYGRLVRRQIMGPVETIPFASEAQVSEDEARASVMNLCAIYRGDWLSAAPSCR